MTVLVDHITDEAVSDLRQETTAERSPDDLTELAARIVSTWPRLSENRKRELGRLLAS